MQSGSLFGDPPDVQAAPEREGRDALLAQLGDSPAALHEYFMQGRSLAGLLQLPNISAAAAQPPPQWRDTHVVRADARVEPGSLQFVRAPDAGPSAVRLRAKIVCATPCVAVAALLAQDVRAPLPVAVGASAASGQSAEFTTELLAVAVSSPVGLDPGPAREVDFDATLDLSRLRPDDGVPAPDSPDCYWPVVVCLRSLDPDREPAPLQPVGAGAGAPTSTPGPAAAPPKAGRGTEQHAAPAAAATSGGAFAASGGAADGAAPLERYAVAVRDAGAALKEEAPSGAGGAGGAGDADGAADADGGGAGDGGSLWGVRVDTAQQHVLALASFELAPVPAASPGDADGDGGAAPALPTVALLEERVQVPQGVYVVREVFGGEGEGAAGGGGASQECVVCLTAPRDTVLLPCRHMCVCSACAQQLRRQTNKCPVCRSVASLMLRFDEEAPPIDVRLDAAGPAGAVSEQAVLVDAASTAGAAGGPGAAAPSA